MSNTSLLEENGSQINNSYDFIQSENLDLYHQSNPKSLSPIVDSLNQNFKKMNFIQNQYNILNNLNQEALYKKEQIIRLKNDDLNKQLEILDRIQSNIANKDRIIDQTNLSIQEYDININISIFIIILSLTLLFAVILFGNKVISYSLLSTIFIVVMVLYGLMLMCIYNILNFRTVLLDLLSKKLFKRAAYELKYLGDKIYSKHEKEVANLKAEWAKVNCDCPIIEEEGPAPIYAIDPNIIVKEIPGVFYYDGTAPQQLLLPTPTPDPNTLGLRQQIEWPDFSPDGSMKYDPMKNSVFYKNDQYYDIANNKGPSIMQSTNPITAPLSAPVTFTADL